MRPTMPTTTQAPYVIDMSFTDDMPAPVYQNLSEEAKRHGLITEYSLIQREWIILDVDLPEALDLLSKLALAMLISLQVSPA